MAGANKYISKQNKEAKKSSGKRGGKFEVDSMSQLGSLPGVRKTKKPR